MTDTLLAEIRQIVADHSKPGNPLVMIGLPRWCALGLARERAAELGTSLLQAHAESLREDPERPTPHAVLWLPIEGHEHGGCFILCHRGYGAGVVIGWRYRECLMFPRQWSEYPGPLCAWRSDQDRWQGKPESAHYMAQLVREMAKTTRKTPACVIPSPAIMEMIQAADDPGPDEDAPEDADDPVIDALKEAIQ